MMSINLNANMNSKMMAYATIMDSLQHDGFGQSLDCVIVVVGCDGTGSVGSSGDTIIGSNNGNNDSGTNDNSTGGNTPLPPLTNCDECIAALPTDVQANIAVALGLLGTATTAEICAAIGLLATVGALVEVLGEAGLSAQAIVNLLACLDIDISLSAVLAILAGVVVG